MSELVREREKKKEVNGKIEFHGVSSLPGAHDSWLHLISGVDGSLFLSFFFKSFFG